MLEFTVGRPFPLPEVKEEGSTFSVEPFSFMLIYRFHKPTEEEVREFREGTVSFSVTELRGVIFLQSRFGRLHWSDTPYSMHLSGSRKNLPELSDGNLGYSLDAFLVDTSTNLLLVHRLVRLDLAFSRKLRLLLLDDLRKPFDEASFPQAVQQVYAAYTSRQMLERGLFSCRIEPPAPSSAAPADAENTSPVHPDEATRDQPGVPGSSGELAVQTHSEGETFALGESLGKAAQPGSVFCLAGDLGTGKTVLAKGMAKGLGISSDVVSPTFTLVREYPDGRLPFYHFDIYRLKNEDELDEIGWQEYLGRDGVILVEWADQVREAMPSDAVWITLARDLSKGPEYRNITIRQGETAT